MILHRSIFLMPRPRRGSADAAIVYLEVSDRYCQTNSNLSQFARRRLNLRGTKQSPLGESGGTVQFEVGTGVEVAFLIEMVENSGLDGGELLQTSHAPEAEHGSLSSSERQVRVFGSIVEPAAGLLPICGADFFQGCAVGSQPVRDDHLWTTVLSHRFLRNFNAACLSRVFVTKLSSTSPS